MHVEVEEKEAGDIRGGLVVADTELEAPGTTRVSEVGSDLVCAWVALTLAELGDGCGFIATPLRTLVPRDSFPPRLFLPVIYTNIGSVAAQSTPRDSILTKPSGWMKR